MPQPTKVANKPLSSMAILMLLRRMSGDRLTTHQVCAQHPKAATKDWFRISDATYVHMKENLSAIRLFHFVSVAVLVAAYNDLILRWSGAGVVARVGRFSLETPSGHSIV
jgi:hypothetical protein